MDRQFRIALVGIGGYGDVYLNSLLGATRARDVQLVAAVDPYPARCRQLHELSSRQIPIYPSMQEMLACHSPDLTVISSPIQFHREHTELALAAGSHVLCEKPLAGSVEDAKAMILARDRSNRTVSIGYQWSSCPRMQQLFSDIKGGTFGSLRQLRAMALWPRDEQYYARNSWAGRLRDDQMRSVFDSPMNNACAHFLHNMLQVLSVAEGGPVIPSSLEAELYRANAIENYDTIAMRCSTDCGIGMLFISSHCTQHTVGPELRYTFDGASIELGESTRGHLIAKMTDGKTVDYGCPATSSDATKLWSTVDAIEQGLPPVCSIEAAALHTEIVCAVQSGAERISTFVNSSIRIAGEPGRRRKWVAGLEEVLRLCFDQMALPAEMGFNWHDTSNNLCIDVATDTGGLVSALSPADRIDRL